MDVDIKLSVRFDGGQCFSKPFMFLGRSSDVNSPSIRPQKLPQPPARMHVRAIENWRRRHFELKIECSSRTCEVSKLGGKFERLKSHYLLTSLQSQGLADRFGFVPKT